jgi:hypothetical protein
MERDFSKISQIKYQDTRTRGKRRQTRVDKTTSVIHTDETTGGKKGRKKNSNDETPSLPHLVQSRWVCASLQQQAHDVGLVLLRRHVKGRLSILQVGRRKGGRRKKRGRKVTKGI